MIINNFINKNENYLTDCKPDACFHKIFASDMFKRIGTAPLGMILLFIVFTSFYLNKGDFVLEKD